MSKFTFVHDGPVYLISDDRFEVAYYTRDYVKYKRARLFETQTWETTTEQEIDRDEFWMVVACCERGHRHA